MRQIYRGAQGLDGKKEEGAVGARDLFGVRRNVGEWRDGTRAGRYGVNRLFDFKRMGLIHFGRIFYHNVYIGISKYISRWNE